MDPRHWFLLLKAFYVIASSVFYVSVVSANSSLIAPDLCSSPNIDAITKTADGRTFAFKGAFYWRIRSTGIEKGYPKLIESDWKGLPNNIDAAITWEDGKSFFFKGDLYWKFLNMNASSEYPRNISDGFPGIPSNLDAALVWSGNSKTYFFKGDQYWKFDSNLAPSTKYPKSMRLWNGLPINLDAAFVGENGRSYFFKGTDYYGFDDRTFSVDQSKSVPYPRDNGHWWFNCLPSTSTARSTEGMVYESTTIMQHIASTTIVQHYTSTGPTHFTISSTETATPTTSSTETATPTTSSTETATPTTSSTETATPTTSSTETATPTTSSTETATSSNTALPDDDQVTTATAISNGEAQQSTFFDTTSTGSSIFFVHEETTVLEQSDNILSEDVSLTTESLEETHSNIFLEATNREIHETTSDSESETSYITYEDAPDETRIYTEGKATKIISRSTTQVPSWHHNADKQTENLPNKSTHSMGDKTIWFSLQLISVILVLNKHYR